VVSSLMFACVLALEVAGLVPSAGAATPLARLIPPFLITSASFFLVAVLAGFLTAQIARTTTRLADTEAQLERLDRLYAEVLRSLPSGVMTIGSSGRIDFVNAAGADILGGNAEDKPGPAALAALAPAGAGRHFETSMQIAGRGQRVIGGSVAPLVGREDEGRVLVFQDLTELRRLQKDVERAERLAELGRMSAGLAHEVRNPLAAMIGCLQLLPRQVGSTLAEEDVRMLAIVQREAERLSALVQQFLTYARPAPPERQQVALKRLLQDVVDAVRFGLARDITLSGDELTLAVDPAQLRQVLWNLVHNAASMVDKEKGQVAIRIAVDGDEAVVRVDDNGPGVPEELRERIFEPFYSTRPDGNGLGLATAHQLVRQHRGGLSLVESALGGACFEVRLPLRHTALRLDLPAGA
jgi:two-component system sensor histidine kinase PilS (NtrC family)